MAAIFSHRRSPSVLPYLFVVKWVLPCVLGFSALNAMLASSILIA